MDCISIKRLETYAYHGVYEEEQENGQHFYVSADLYLTTRNAGISDDLQCSGHYGEVCEFINEFMKNIGIEIIKLIKIKKGVKASLSITELLSIKVFPCPTTSLSNT